MVFEEEQLEYSLIEAWQVWVKWWVGRSNFQSV